MKFKLYSKKIREILKEIKNSKIILPKFQRGSIWTKNQEIELKNSITSESPIGSLFLYKKIGNKKVLLDGQQRCTALIKIRENYKKDYESIMDYSVPIIEYIEKEGQSDDIAGWFVNMNKTGTPLDKEDIHISILSVLEVDISKFGWLDGDDRKKIYEMYKIKNKVFDSPKQEIIFTITELFYFLSEKLKGFSQNHDKYIMAKYHKATKNNNPIKSKLIWIKRILICLFAKDLDDALMEKRTTNFDKKIFSWLENVYKDKKSFYKFCKKLSFILESFHTKFWFSNIAFSNSGAERKGVSSFLGLQSYMTIYLFDFLKTNKNLILEKSKSLEVLKEVFKKHKINFLDIAYFMTNYSISSGGIEGWFKDILFSNQRSNKLFISKKNSINYEFIIENIFNKAMNDNKKIKTTTKLSLLWFFRKKIENNYKKYKLGNNPKKKDSKHDKKKNKFFEFDHTIPYDHTKEYNNCTSLENISILPQGENKTKHNSIEEIYMEKDWINKEIKNHNSKDYKIILQLIKKWRNKNNKVDQKNFAEFIKLRQKNLKEIFINKLAKEWPTSHKNL